MHVWLYENLHQRQEAREAAARDPDVQRVPGGRTFVVSQEAEMSASPGLRGKISTYGCCYCSFMTGRVTARRVSTGNQGLSGPHHMRRSVYHFIVHAGVAFTPPHANSL